jgi:threonine synthase
MDYARTHRSQFMWPWETEPHSIAHGILDDETYDWAAVVEGMLLSDGHAVVVDEPALKAANALARDATSVNVDHTGSAGLAGLLQLVTRADRPSPDERVAIMFSGVRRMA